MYIGFFDILVYICKFVIFLYKISYSFTTTKQLELSVVFVTQNIDYTESTGGVVLATPPSNPKIMGSNPFAYQ